MIRLCDYLSPMLRRPKNLLENILLEPVSRTNKVIYEATPNERSVTVVGATLKPW